VALKTRNLKKLASLSAVGAGALAITADKAEAASIFTNYVPLNQTVGFAAGDSPFADATFRFPATCGCTGSSIFGFLFGTAVGATRLGDAIYRSIGGYGIGVFRNATGTSRFPGLHFAAFSTAAPGIRTSSLIQQLAIVDQGKTWFQVVPNPTKVGYYGGTMGGRVWLGNSTNTSHHLFGNTSFQDKYLLFQFGFPTAPPRFGWIELSYSVTDAWGPACGAQPNCGDPGNLGPELTLEGFAYETLGSDPVPLPAGFATPEPGTLAATGLAALALGAAGLRRWRAARKG
jgi:hypothetical protein